MDDRNERDRSCARAGPTADAPPRAVCTLGASRSSVSLTVDAATRRPDRVRPDPRGAVALLLAVTAALLSACFAPALPDRTAAESTFQVERDPVFGLGPEDKLRVTVVGHPELSSPGDGLLVDPDGRISLPLIGAVDCDGREPEEVRAEIEARFEVYVKRPSVLLSVSEFGAHRVYVLGHVDSPGEYVLPGPRNVLQALSLAGGFKDGADRANIAVLRPLPDGEIDVHVFDADSPGADGLVAVHSGDLMFVRQTGAGKFAEQARPVLTTMSSVIGTATNVWDTVDRLTSSP